MSVVQTLRQKYYQYILLFIAQLHRATFYYRLKQMNRTDKYEADKAEIAVVIFPSTKRLSRDS